MMSRRVAVVSVTQGTAKPYVVRHKDREEIYVRVGSTSRKASREQQARLFALGGMLHAELLPVSGTGFGISTWSGCTTIWRRYSTIRRFPRIRRPG